MLSRPGILLLFVLGSLWSLRVAFFYCQSCGGPIDVPKHLESSCEKYEQVSVVFAVSRSSRYIKCLDATIALSRGELLSVDLVVDSSRAPSFGLLRHLKLCRLSALGESGGLSDPQACWFESNGL